MKTILEESDFKNIFEVQKAQKNKVLSIYGQEQQPLEKAEKVEVKNLDEFSHHRLMAGYHSHKADEFAKEVLQLNSADNSELHNVAKEKKKEINRHKEAAQEHRNKAKSLHDPKQHGDWNNTIPSQLDALKYGSKQAKQADKKVDLIEKEEDMTTDYKKEENK